MHQKLKFHFIYDDEYVENIKSSIYLSMLLFQISRMDGISIKLIIIEKQKPTTNQVMQIR